MLFGVGFVSACEVDLLWYEIPFNRPIDCQDSFLALKSKIGEDRFVEIY